MECQQHTCGTLEICKIVDDVRGCHPMNFGTMRLYGHRHYITFDGFSYDYRGVCKYTLTKYCGLLGKLPGFAIKVLNAHRSSIAVTGTKLVEMEVYGEHITITEGHYGKVQVRIFGGLFGKKKKALKIDVSACM